MPDLKSSDSKVKLHPIKKETKSFCQYGRMFVCSSTKRPFLKILYRGKSVLRSESGAVSRASNLPASITSIKGQGAGFLEQKRRKSKAKLSGKITRLV